MSRLLPCLLSLLLLAPLAAQADNDRYDRRDRRYDERRFDRHFDRHRFDRDRRFDHRFHDRRFDPPFAHRHDGRAIILGKQSPWRGHYGWRDYGSRRFDQFHPGSRAFHRRTPHGFDRRHHSSRPHHPGVRGGHFGAHRHRR